MLAAESGIDLPKFLDEEDLAKVRQARSLQIHAPPPPARTRDTVSPVSGLQKHVVIAIGKGLKLIDPNLPEKLIREAYDMASVYPLIYVFENSARHLITTVLKGRYGKSWWDQAVSSGIRKKVEGRMNSKTRWHRKRGAHPIFYTDFGDLANVIVSNWGDFRHLFPDVAWVRSRINEYEELRNVVNHSNPLSKTNIQRLEMYLPDWINQISVAEAED